MPRNWTEHELLIAMNLYCRLPFGQFDHRTELIKTVAPKISRTPDALAMKLSNIASLDSYHQVRGIVGLKGASNLDRKVWEKFQQDWTGMAEKSEAAFEILVEQTSATSSTPEIAINIPTGPSEAEQIVKTRRLQCFFRNAVLASYENRCALTGMAIPQLLVASHIIPWSENKERRADPTNGLCLNVLHDKAFDRHLITFDEKFQLVVSGALKKNNIPEFQSVNFTKLEGTALTMPHRFAPDVLALEEHRATFAAEQ